MADPDAWDLLPAYALDDVDDLERRQVERLLDSDPEARRALDEYRETVAAFVVDTAPPAALRDSVIERATTSLVPDVEPVETPDVVSTSSTNETPVEPTETPVEPVETPVEPVETQDDPNVVPLDRARRRRFPAWAAAAAAVVAIAIPSYVAVDQSEQRQVLEAQTERIADMLADPDAELVTSPVTGGGEASALVAGDDVLFTASGLPEAGEDSDYQLWIVAGEDISSAGLLEDPSGDTSAAFVEAAAGQVVAMTLEPAGGSDQPTSDPIVVLAT
ncbi:Anti-sigma-K factor rskA [Paraoerskovia marina]|uniref:Regulator of SigK n=1 Tax=Paraoerskovia marina TaxID=545619 RepID=A0A1H1MX78_9CELL|nr:anti-sigma factor [Paraoerskovia marina]SDR91218.1 Anti-sigma-K factor rskA [Paraoerskovia marina]